MKRQLLLSTLLLVSFNAIRPFNTPKKTCTDHNYRCIVDIGSIATKIGCTNHAHDFYFETEQPVAYRADYKNRQKKNLRCFSSGIKEKGVSVISSLVNSAISAIQKQKSNNQCLIADNGRVKLSCNHAIAFHALATASLRPDPACGEEMAATIFNQTGVPLTIIDQNQEGQLAYNGIIAQLHRPAQQIISWDLGGGSMQMIATDKTGKQIDFLVEEGMFFFRDVLMKAFGKQEENYHNELTRREIKKALHIAYEHAFKKIISNLNLITIQRQIDDPKTIIVGTDGIAFVVAALMQQPHRTVFTREEIEAALLSCADQTDIQLGKRFNVFIAPAFLSGCALMIGYMHALDIKTVTLFMGGALRAGALTEDSFF